MIYAYFGIVCIREGPALHCALTSHNPTQLHGQNEFVDTMSFGQKSIGRTSLCVSRNFRTSFITIN